MKRRGFTLIEVMIVTVMVSLLLAATLTQYVSDYRFFHTQMQRADQRSEATLMAARAFQHARGGYTVDADNHGLKFKDGLSLRWQDQRLNFNGRSLISSPVSDFTAVRQNGLLTLNLRCQGTAYLYAEPKP